MNRIVGLLLVLLVFPFGMLKAQDEIAIFINESKVDANKMAKAYGTPLLKSLGTDFNNGWINTADPMNFGEFDVRIVTTGSFAPKSDKTFDFNALNLTHFQSSESELPTIFGTATDAELTVLGTVEDGTELEIIGDYTIPTIEAGGFPLAMPQVDIGLFKGTELMIRGLPPMDMPTFDDNLKRLETTYWGLGLKHDIKQWIPGLKLLPFSWSVFGTYSNANLTMNGPFWEPADIEENFDNNTFTNPNPENYDSQKMEFDTKGWTIGTVVSKKFPVITLFGGFEYNASTTKLAMTGHFPYANADSEIEHIEDVINLEQDNGQVGITGGARFKLLILSITASGTYSPQGYSSLNLAVGLGNFR
ncbi:MAG: DUF6588 family protein [Bacteroidota bacterium]|nr:DUF6588 family protein [Bacteroidota bacterium]